MIKNGFENTKRIRASGMKKCEQCTSTGEILNKLDLEFILQILCLQKQILLQVFVNERDLK